MSLATFIRAMPKVELHVHLEGSIRPATLLTLARRHRIGLPADTEEGLRVWYAFTDFAHFVQVYLAVSDCLRTPDDLEWIAREFLAGQAEQGVLYSEVTYTAYTHYRFKGLAFRDQLAALNRVRTWAAAELGTTMGLVLDIPRTIAANEGNQVADWAIEGMGDGVVALGLGGPEVGHPPEKFQAAFSRARAAGLPRVPHAGEMVGPPSIWGALHALDANRIGHGIRCLEDPRLVEELRRRQIPLEVCPTSNVCLGVVPSLAAHPLPRLLEEHLHVTLNSDDPPMFNTTLTDEYLAVARAFHFGPDELEQLVLNAVRAALLPPGDRQSLETRCTSTFTRLRAEHLPEQRREGIGTR
ncbi:MAG: adenosine deaminase [Gemmataceae bacterium]|nr:adenosine deaminase [Gemmataceae bacterium]